MNQNNLRKTFGVFTISMLLLGTICNSGAISASELHASQMTAKLENASSNNRIIAYKTNSPNETRGATVEMQTLQQTQIISGTVIDELTGEPVIGANVIVKGTMVGTVTDYDGKFSFEAPGGSTLVISYIGYLNMEITATSSPMTIRLSEDTHALEEIVVVGYGVQKKESLTGALQTLNNEKLTNITTPSAENMIGGKVPGVLVAPGDGRPGSAGTILIRGKASINGNTNPLWVIDGVIVGNSPNNTLNPADIESMTVLKDAASTAIYGSQGANGVIVVTTKKAQANSVSVSASARVGFTELSNGNMKMMNGSQLYDYYKSFSNQEEIVFPRWNEDLRNSNYNWWDIATQTGLVQDYNISLSGGTEKLRSFLSLGMYDETGAVEGYDYKRYNFRFRSDYKPFEWITVKPLISGSRRDIDNRERSVTAMYLNQPWDSPYLEDGTPTPHRSPTWVNSALTNYLYDLQWNHSGSATHTFMGNLDFDITFTDWLSFSSINNYTWDNYAYNDYIDPRSDSGSGVNGRIEETNQRMERQYTNQILRFNKTFGKHAVNGLVAYEFNDFNFKRVQAIGTGFVPGFNVLDVTALPEKTAGYIIESAMQSYLFNANYAYDSKYLAQVSFRRDGASNFGDNAKYGNFYSISGGWNIQNEAFFNAEWVDVLKLRASYGSTGNRPNSLYPQYDLYSVDQKYNGLSGALINQIGNKDLTWEKTYTLGIGLDLNAFNNRLRATFDFYNKRTDNVLFRVPVSGLTGVTTVWRNIGEVSNKGLEITLGGDIIQTKDWLWNVDVNFGLNRNKIVELYSENDIIDSNFGGPAGSASRILRKGYDIDTWYIQEWAGVNPETGAPQWYRTVKDDNGNETREITENYAQADQVMCGTFTPDFFGGFSTGLVFKNFDLNAVFSYSVGSSIYNYSRQEYDSDGAYTDRNQMVLLDNWNRWEKPGDIATHPIASYGNKSNSNKVSSRYLEDGDYLKMRSLTIGYNLALPQYHISNLRFFFSAENVFTWTGYSGVDPELPVRSLEGSSAAEGVSSVVNVAGPAVYPTTRKFMFGINITL